MESSQPMQKVIQSYHDALAKRGYKADRAQLLAIDRLQILANDLVSAEQSATHKSGGFFKKIFTKNQTIKAPRGVYFWGGVGRGKSFLMDCFYKEVQTDKKVRIHFHEFMRSIHQELHAMRHTEDPLDHVAKVTAGKYELICFDEFHVSDIADAMILYRLLSKLLEYGVTFVMTSNYEPSTLYPDGLQRERLLPAIDLIKEKMDVLNIDTGVDYRRRTLEQVKLYYTPLGPQTDQALVALYKKLAQGDITPVDLRVENRNIHAKAASGSVVWFDFANLCETARSQNDYLELAACYHTIFLSDVPKMDSSMAQAARRFTWLIDVLYDFKVKLVMSAQCPAEELYTKGVLANEFYRTVSRILEMQSKEYLSQECRMQVKL